ncbi:RNA polymerase sigma factor [Chitinophaga sp. Cy-1792]|uniref:RNA polymerase sigma factor n=1 Tax=Chitinophaga sp. Cy-1792 TaxID=2608339 RepID=UPI00141FCAE4|nr:sigma-70 family RNA polymerase sigma factor [Chitinophaga sp. Cy-1792]NIG56958.1 sigma-70 family RNA polymerase sigma factor [Chitinophaga sp. Cy-1792]
MPDAELWTLLKSGEITGLEGLYKEYFPILSNYGLKFTLDKSFIEESINDLFLKLWRNRETIDTPRVAKHYLLLSFRRMLIRKLSSDPGRQEDAISAEYVPFNLELTYEHPLIRAERASELKQKVDKLLDTLTNRQREAIFLKFYEDLSYEEIGDILDINTTATYKLVYRALERLREQLGGFSLLVLLLLLPRR